MTLRPNRRPVTRATRATQGGDTGAVDLGATVPTEGPVGPSRPDPGAAEAAAVLERSIRRRSFVRAALATGALLGTRVATAAPARATPRTRLPGGVLRPGRGPIDGELYLPSRAEEVL